MNEPTVTIIGNLTGDPELRFTPSGAAVANVNIASTPRKYNRETNSWDDGTTLFIRGSVWREMAENVAESLHRGDRVIATGVLVQNNWQDKESGANRSSIDLQIEEIGPSLRYGSATFTKGQRSGAQQAQQGQQGDPWASPGAGVNSPQAGAQQQQAPQGQPPAQGQPQPQQQGQWGSQPQAPQGAPQWAQQNPQGAPPWGGGQ